MNLKELGYVVLAASNLEDWTTYATQALGGMVSQSKEGFLRVRFDERDCRILINQAHEDKLQALGWLVTDEDAYDAALLHVQAQGQAVVMGTEAECVARRVNAFFAVYDPAGNRHEIGWAPVVNFREMFHSPIGVRSFHTNEQGMGHVVIGSEPEQYEACCLFNRQVLGLKLANFRRQSLSEEPLKMPVSWFHCDNSRQHSLGFAACFEPGKPRHGLRHINLEVSSIDEVGRVYDRAPAYGGKIVRTLGRHVNDRAISFYMLCPSGFQLEYGCDAPARTWSEEIVFDEGGIGSIWGHHWVR